MKVTSLIVVIAFAFFIIPTYAEEADLCQTSLGSVYDNRNQKVIVTGTQFIGMSSVEPFTVMIVPSGKNFVVTHITGTPVSSNNFGIVLLENKTAKAIISFSPERNVQQKIYLEPGITFAPGSSVVLKRKLTGGGGCISFSGYLIETKRGNSFVNIKTE